MSAGTSPMQLKFPAETLRQLFEAVEINDSVDARPALPEAIVLSCADETLQRCYALCLQFWNDGFTREDLLCLLGKLLRNEGLSSAERLQYKYIRARYKHLRFAQRLYGKRHKSSFLLDRTTRFLGHLQDAFGTDRRGRIVYYGLLLHVLLSKPVWSMTRREMERTQLDSGPGLVAYQKAEMRRLKEAMASAAFAGHEFHEVRKIVSAQVAYYDTLRTLEPSEHAYRMSRFLAAINGRMGARHDEMIAESLAGLRAYGTPAPLADEIRSSLQALVAHYPF